MSAPAESHRSSSGAAAISSLTMPPLAPRKPSAPKRKFKGHGWSKSGSKETRRRRKLVLEPPTRITYPESFPAHVPTASSCKSSPVCLASKVPIPRLVVIRLLSGIPLRNWVQPRLPRLRATPPIMPESPPSSVTTLRGLLWTHTCADHVQSMHMRTDSTRSSTILRCSA